MYILDTDTIIYFFKNKGAVINTLMAKRDRAVTTSINQAELFFGAYHSQRKNENLKRLRDFFLDIDVLPFDEDASELFGQYKALLTQKGNVIEDADLMIASIAIAHDAILVTHNIKHFARLEGLKYETWVV